jgi:hypothetical protein
MNSIETNLLSVCVTVLHESIVLSPRPASNFPITIDQNVSKNKIISDILNV